MSACKFKTPNGNCKRKTKNSLYCWQHVKMKPEMKPEKTSVKKVAKKRSTSEENVIIMPPPEFMPPNPNECEGYWSDKSFDEDATTYLPCV